MDYTNNIIYLYRGDSFCKPILINVGTKLKPIYYKLTDQDTLYFGLMEPNKAFEDAIIKKKYTVNDDTDEDGNTLLKIEPYETLNLSTGKYYYMVKLQTVDSFQKVHVKTVIPMSQFFLEGNTKEVPPAQPNYIPDEVVNIILDGGEVINGTEIIFHD